MAEFLLRRVFISAITLGLISLIVFTGVRMIPGDPARVLAGTEADAAGIEEIRQKYGLHDPLVVQYLRWVGLAIRGRTRQSVGATVLTKLPITVELAVLSLLVALAIAIPAGVIAAVRRNTIWDLLASGISLCGVSVPNFWLGIMMILLVSVRFGWLPASGFVPIAEDPVGNLKRMLMPSLVLGTGLAAVLMRQTRNAMIEVLSADYIRTARSKGLVEAVFTRDYPVVQGVVLITASSYVLVNLLVDVSYSVLNPRIRVGGGAR
jgi:peptide/nickel transport system permease protein